MLCVGEGLHPRRRKILDFLASTRRDGLETPSEREIGRAVGLSSSQTVHHHILWLEDEEYLERAPGGVAGRKRRPVRLTEKGWGVVGEAPLLGRIAAGRGLEALAVGESYSLTAGLLASSSGRSRYLLRVVGESMRDAGIREGDLLIVEEDPSPPDGAIVVALLYGGEEVTVKRLRRENGHVRLRAQSVGYEDIVVESDEVEVQGRVVWTLHPSEGA